ncbi:MAG TPA: DUF2269 family protein [Gaiellaceae bacterium]
MVAIAFRPESWNGLLFVHLFAAMTLFGGVLVSTIAGVAAARRDSTREIFLLTRVSYRTDLFVTWPSLVVLFAAGVVLARREDVFGEAWVKAGMAVTVAGPILCGIVLTWLNHRVMRRSARLVAEGVEHSEELRRMADNPIFKLLGPPLLLLFVVLFWLMTAKP